MVTLKDVALASGVSTATVSYVVNKGPRTVTAETRERVLQTIARLGYQPNFAARSLMGKRTHTFGVVLPHVVPHPFDNHYFGGVLSGVIDEATERKQFAMLFTGLDWGEAEKSVPYFCDGRCDGFIFVAPPPNSSLVATIIERQKHVVLVGTHPGATSVSYVDIDNVEASRMATRHLLDLGHQDIALLQGRTGTTSTMQRLEGFKSALAERGIPSDRVPIVPDRKPDETSFDVALRLLQSPEGKGLTGLVCGHDSIALGAMEAVRAIGKRVPEDISVVGFDDVPWAQSSDPQITTVRQPLREIGASAASILLDIIENPGSPPRGKVLGGRLIVRGSSAPPG